MPSPAAVLVSNGAIAAHAPPSAAAFLDSTPGAYTTARCSGSRTLLWWPRHLRRLAESATLLARSHPHLLGLPLPFPRSRALDLDFLSIHSLVSPSVRVAIHEMRARLPVAKAEDLALTALVRAAGADDSVSGSADGLDVFVHVGTFAPPVFGESGARLAVAGRGRDAATTKYASWARIRKNLEKMRPPGVTELLLSNDGDHILEGTVTNFFVVCQQEEREQNGQFSNQTTATKFEVHTAPLSDGVLPGIIRQIVIEILIKVAGRDRMPTLIYRLSTHNFAALCTRVCHDTGIPVREMSPSWSKNEFWKEAFVTSSLRLIQHVESVQVPSFWEDIQSKTWNDVPWAVKKFQGAGCITTKIQREILKRARREEYGINSLL